MPKYLGDHWLQWVPTPGSIDIETTTLWRLEIAGTDTTAKNYWFEGKGNFLFQLLIREVHKYNNACFGHEKTIKNQNCVPPPPKKKNDQNISKYKIVFQDCIFGGALPPQAPKKTSNDWTSLASRPPSSRWLHVVVLAHEDEVVGVPLTPHLLTYHEHIYTHLDFTSIVNLYLPFQDFSIYILVHPSSTLWGQPPQPPPRNFHPATTPPTWHEAHGFGPCSVERRQCTGVWCIGAFAGEAPTAEQGLPWQQVPMVEIQSY